MHRFPYLIPEDDRPDPESSGLTTINQLLLHGARYHHREHLFRCYEPSGDEAHRDEPRAKSHPDWRADRASIRIALALRERFSLGEGDGVAIDWPFDWQWLLLERAVLGLGAHTVTPPSGARALSSAGRVEWLKAAGVSVAFVSTQLLAESEIREALSSVPVFVRGARNDSHVESSWERLLDYGATLDTPERATGWRTLARRLGSETRATVDWQTGVPRPWSQGQLAQAVHGFLKRYPPNDGATHVIQSQEPELAARVVAFGGWADGRTSLVLTQSNPMDDDARLWSPRRVFFMDRDRALWKDSTETVRLDELVLDRG